MRLAQPTSFSLAGGRSPIVGDEGDEFGEVAIDVAEIAMGVGEGFGDLQEEARVANTFTFHVI